MIGFGIIGTGAVAVQHVKSIRELNNCRLVAMASTNPERAALAARKFAVRTYSNFQYLVTSPDIQIVIVCTASGHHLEPVLAAAKAGKHVLVEKPLEVDLDRADQMIEACNAAGVQLGCIFQNRFSTDYLYLKHLVQDGALGRLIMGNAYIKWFRSASYYQSSQWKGTLKGDGGAALINQGIHTIDLLVDIMGPVKSVFGKVKTIQHNIEGEDLGVALLQFENDALGTIEGSTSIYPGYPERLEIFGEKGSLILEGGRLIAKNIKGEEQHTIGSKSNHPSGAADPNAIGHQLHKAQIKDFVDAIHNNRKPLVDGIEGRKALELILAIYQSSKLKKEIEL